MVFIHPGLHGSACLRGLYTFRPEDRPRDQTGKPAEGYGAICCKRHTGHHIQAGLHLHSPAPCYILFCRIPLRGLCPGFFLQQVRDTTLEGGRVTSLLPPKTMVFTPLFGLLVERKGRSATAMILDHTNPRNPGVLNYTPRFYFWQA